MSKKTVLVVLIFTIVCLSFLSCSNENKKNGGTEMDEGSIKYEPDDLTVLSDYVDFVVDVPEGRQIRVLQLTDVQTISADLKRYPNRVSSSSPADTVNGYKKYIGQVIERYNPDFIIMTGDNVYGEFDDGGEYLLELIEYMDSFKIPWAPVLGNHDAESNMGVDWQCEQYEKSEYCLFKQRELTGNGNYSVALTQGGRVKRVFYMLDSNGSSNMSEISFANGHSQREVGFGEDQIEWYTESITALKEQYPNAKLSMAFHVQISTFGSALKAYSASSELPIDLDKNKEAQKAGDFGYYGSKMKNPWDQSHKVYGTIMRLGVDSVFVGHEHRNSASAVYNNVRYTYGQKSSTFDRYNTDKNGPVIGGTYILLSENDGSIEDAGLYLYDSTIPYEVKGPAALTPDNAPEGATVTVLDFDNVGIDTVVTTNTISDFSVSEVTDLSAAPTGFDGAVYGGRSDNASAIGIGFSKPINTDKLLGMFVKMYVGDYTAESGKNPLLRIYNSTDNNILSSAEFSALGGEPGKWVYVDILGLVKNAEGVVNNGRLDPFTLVYRYYGLNEGQIYFDSVTLISDGDPYTFDGDSSDESIAYARGEKYRKYDLKEVLGGNEFSKIDSDKYSVCFNLTANEIKGGFTVSGYVSEKDKSSGIGVRFTKGEVSISDYKADFEFEAGKSYNVEVGFVGLYNGNTVYVFVKIDSKTVAWELVESFGKTVGNVALH